MSYKSGNDIKTIRETIEEEKEETLYLITEEDQGRSSSNNFEKLLNHSIVNVSGMTKSKALKESNLELIDEI